MVFVESRRPRVWGAGPRQIAEATVTINWGIAAALRKGCRERLASDAPQATHSTISAIAAGSACTSRMRRLTLQPP